jgi:hypothetical protein
MAERAGFEPAIPFWSILTFQASAFDHSATSPLKARAYHEGACGRKRLDQVRGGAALKNVQGHLPFP